MEGRRVASEHTQQRSKKERKKERKKEGKKERKKERKKKKKKKNKICGETFFLRIVKIVVGLLVLEERT